jgi:BlaI family transcriptional regulator, penicillinase repressor
MTTISISLAESVVMQALWSRDTATSEDLIASVAAANDWQEATVRTLINRLLNKGAISAEREGRRYVYRPLMAESDWVTEESSGLLDRLFGGRIAPLVAHFSQEGKLSREDIRDLKKLIREIDDAK